MFRESAFPAAGTVSVEDARSPRLADGPLPDWREVLGILLRRWAWIAGAALAALLLAIAALVLLPPTFTAGTEVLVQPTDLKAVEGAVSQPANQPDTSVALLETAARVLTSHRVLEPVVVKLHLADDPEFRRRPSPLREALARLRRLAGGAAPEAPSPVEGALLTLEKHLAVRRPERTYVIDLAVKSKDADKAARIANAIVASFVDAQATARADAARRVSASLGSRLDELRAGVRRAEDAAQRFRVANDLAVANGQLLDEQQLAEASAQLLTAKQRTADALAKYDQMKTAVRGRDPGTIPESLQSQAVTALRTQLAQSTEAEASSAAVLGARHPQLAQLRSRVEAARRALDGEIQRIRDTARDEYERARSAEANLRANLGKQRAGSEKAGAARIRLRELEREAEAERGVYEAFLKRNRETAEQESVNTFDAWVISPASPPAERSSPPPNAVVLAAALGLGLMVGTALALLRERLDPRLWTRGRVEGVTGLPVLAEIDARRSRRAGAGWGRAGQGRAGRGLAAALDDEALADLARDLAGSGPASPGRIVLLLGTTAEDAGLAAQRLAAAAEGEGRAATAVHLAAETGEGIVPFRGGLQAGPSAGGSARSRGRRVDLPEPMQPSEVPGLVERVRSLAAHIDGGLVIVIGRWETIALPQLAAAADAGLLVLARARATREEARGLARRLDRRAGVLRGSILLTGAARAP